MLFIQMPPTEGAWKITPEVYIINNDGEVEGARLSQIQVFRTNEPRPIELEGITLTHRWEVYPKDMGYAAGHYNHHDKAQPKNFHEIHSLYKERVGNTGLSFEQWLSVLPGLGGGSLPVDYIGLYRCSEGKHWVVSIHKCKLTLTEITENTLIVGYAVKTMEYLVDTARRKAQAKLDLIDTYTPKVLSEEFLGDISYRLSEEHRLPIASFIIEELVKS